MFVRWQARQRGPKSRPDEAYTLWTASLVASERQDGQPRQRHLAYLGCFREYAKRWWSQATYQDAVILRATNSCGFWDDADGRLDALDLSPADRQRIEAALAQKVARPTERQRRELAEARARWAAAHARL